jgi:hypothetical protein
MSNESLTSLFLELHKSYIKTADSHLKKTELTGHTLGMKLQGDWVSALPDPRDEGAGIKFKPSWRSDWNVIKYPDWLSLTRITPAQSKIIRGRSKDLKINRVLIEKINKESHGLWVLYLNKLYEKQIDQKTMIYEELAYLELLCPNIFSVSAKIVSGESFGKIRKTITSIGDLDRNAIENKSYNYISGIRKLKQKKHNSFSPVIKSKKINWTSKVYPPTFPVSFNLTKIEAKILVAHELFKMEILPLLQFKKIRKRVCKSCDRKFDPSKEIGWFGVMPPTICSICVQMAMNMDLVAYEQFRISKHKIKQNAIAGIIEFEKIFGFIPASYFDRKAALLALSDKKPVGSKYVEIIRALAVLPRPDTVKKYFGSWAELLHAAGVLEKSRTTYGGYRSIGSDGHICLSIGERLICENLTTWKIRHTKEPLYPFDADLNPRTNLRADFKVKGTLIEYAGRMSNEAYEKQISRKISLARKKRIRLIVLETVDNDVLDNLRRRLNYH